VIELIEMCLRQYDYVKINDIKYDDLWFYKKSNKNIASYFIIYSIDCTDFESDNESMKDALENLEAIYSKKQSDSESVKTKILNSFTNAQEASQVDKNTSAIYLLKFNNISNLNMHRNLVYAIEESPNYFKRYILPYTQGQLEGIKKAIIDYETLPVNEVLSDIANDEDEYYKLMDGLNVGSTYELVIRLFSKMPFLQYRFKAGTMPKPIEEDIAQKVDEHNLTEFHTAIQALNYTLEEFLSLIPDNEIKKESLDRELAKLLGGTT